MAKDWRPFVVLGVLAGLWWLLSDGDPASWVIGLPTVATAGWYAQRLGNGHGGAASLTGLLHFMPFFFRESLRGGGDVALRTLAPRMRINPGFTELRTKLRRQDARKLLVNCMNLLPGTLAADLRGDTLSVHLLDVAVNAEQELRRLERAIARIFPGSL